ncbi:MAG: TatD family hydrolase [Bacteroidetes bacterium]|nr:TatD family hydrolase [Bacteroidota bacterium]
MRWIDTHAHLYAEEFAKDQQEVIGRAQEEGVERIFMPNVDGDSIDQMLETEHRFSFCRPMMGLHPCYVKKGFERTLYEVESWLNRRPFAAIGEIGTDLYWDKTFWPEQQEAFRIQVGWAIEKKLPVVIHCRNSFDETIELLKPFEGKGLRGIFHCFSGNKEQLDQVINLGFLAGIGGVVTFKNGGLDTILPDVSLDHLVVETDSPYLAPVPHRGKRNEPAYIRKVTDKLSQVLGVSEQELSERTSANADKLFGPG